jgi:hypothetical protein
VVTYIRSEGNLVHELDASNPARLLLAAVRQHSPEVMDYAQEDIQFYMGAIDGGDEVSHCDLKVILGH